MSAQSLLDGRRIGRVFDVGRIVWLVQRILVSGVVRGLGHVVAEVTAWVSPSFVLDPLSLNLILLVLGSGVIELSPS